jgi:hypothetical protein
MAEITNENEVVSALRQRLKQLRARISTINKTDSNESSSCFLGQSNMSEFVSLEWPDRFMTNDSLESCSLFHDATTKAFYIKDEILSAGEINLENAVRLFFDLTADSGIAVQEAAFSACFDMLMDITRLATLPSRTIPQQDFQKHKLTSAEMLARDFLIQSVASRRPSVKLRRIHDAIQVLSETVDSANADGLLDILTRILPAVPQIRETSLLLRSFIDAGGDPSIQIGPIGYSLTSLEAVIGVL